jgi:hypothetical protein
VYLPRAAGVYRVEVGTDLTSAPHLCRAGEPVRRCEFDPAGQVLTVEFAATTRRGQTIWVSGAPRSVVGGAVIEEHEFGYRPADLGVATHNGVMIRVAQAVVQVHYLEEVQ